MDKDQIKELLAKYKANACTEEELAILESWYLNFEHEEFSDLTEEEKEHDLNLVWNNMSIASKKSKRSSLRYLSAAAILFIAISAGLFFYNNNGVDVANSTTVADDVAPGGNKAILTLANGKRISLTDAADGTVMQRNDQIMVFKDEDGKLVYSVSSSDKKPVELSYNVLETPVGGQYQVVLPDGTNVWLNAASSIKFPTSFSGQSFREVELHGEGYFEVKHNQKQPFKVITTTQVVEVLGTHFNINAYKEELAVKTTLIEGRVKVNGSFLKPGEQSTVSDAGLRIESVDVETAMAWKNGLFMFDNENLSSVMRKISKWYGVQVIYTDETLKNVVFEGTISKFDHVSKVLRKLELTGIVSFKIEDKSITVMPSNEH